MECNQTQRKKTNNNTIITISKVTEAIPSNWWTYVAIDAMEFNEKVAEVCGSSILTTVPSSRNGAFVNRVILGQLVADALQHAIATTSLERFLPSVVSSARPQFHQLCSTTRVWTEGACSVVLCASSSRCIASTPQLIALLQAPSSTRSSWSLYAARATDEQECVLWSPPGFKMPPNASIQLERERSQRKKRSQAATHPETPARCSPCAAPHSSSTPPPHRALRGRSLSPPRLTSP